MGVGGNTVHGTSSSFSISSPCSTTSSSPSSSSSILASLPAPRNENKAIVTAKKPSSCLLIFIYLGLNQNISVDCCICSRTDRTRNGKDRIHSGFVASKNRFEIDDFVFHFSFGKTQSQSFTRGRG